MKKFNYALVIILVCTVSISAWACGDSLYRVGKGVSYRVYTAPLPGNVLVYGQTEGARQLAEALAASGHQVTLADSEMELSLDMSQQHYDVVIAAYTDRNAVEASASASNTTYLPVALNEEEAQVAEQNYDEVMIADQDEIKNYLKAIHKTLKSKA